jgi:hypothetical protein
LEARVPARLSAREGRKFAFTVGGAFLALAALAWWRQRVLPSEIFGVLGGLFVVAGVVAPSQLGPVNRAWMGLDHAISKVTTPVFMAVVYFVVVTPIGLLMRLVGRRPLVHAEQGGGFWKAPPSGGRSDRNINSSRLRKKWMSRRAGVS